MLHALRQEGLSYSVGSGINAHPIDERTTLTIFAITNPENRDRVVEVIGEEIALLLKDGITTSELDDAKQGYLQSEQLDRTQDRVLASVIASTIFADRSMEYYAQFERSIAELDIEAVNAALRKYIQPKRLVVVTAGDFGKLEK